MLDHDGMPSTQEARYFAFGKNWKNFISFVDEQRLGRAVGSLRDMLHKDNLDGLRILDAGCGSGLFSLAALRLGAREVVSIDIDAESLQCANYLNDRYGPFPHWKTFQGSILERDWMAGLGLFDIVYSWGVLHHTGDLWRALENITIPVAPDGVLFLSIYNDQGFLSSVWKIIKRLHNRSPKAIRLAMAVAWYVLVVLTAALSGIARLRPPKKWFDAANARGMSTWHDTVDWIGGYPFEPATPESIFRFYRDRGFSLIEMKLKRGSGCNEFVFQRSH